MTTPLMASGYAQVYPDLASLYAPYGGSGFAADTRGGAFLPDSMPGARQIIELAFGADLTAHPTTWTWTDVTHLVLWDPGVNYTIGRGDERMRAQPARCSFTLKNFTNDFTERNVASIYFPYVKLNTPARVSLDLGVGPTVEFQGEVSNGFEARIDHVTGENLCDVVASGVKQRLAQGQSPIITSIAAAVAAGPAPIASWMMQDGASSTQAISSIAGAPALDAIGNTTLGNTANPALPGTTTVASQPIPSGTVGPALSGNVPLHTRTGFYAFDYWTNIYAADTLATVLFNMQAQFTGGDFALLATVAANQVHGATRWVTFYGTDSFNIGTLTSTGDYAFGNGWTNVFLTLEQVGPNVVITTEYNGIPGGGATLSGITMGTLFRMDLVNAQDVGTPGEAGVVQFGPLTVWTSAAAHSSFEIGFGYAGELCTDRMLRLAAEYGIQIDIRGSSSIPMGPQAADTFTNLMDACADADGGLLLDGLGPGYTYICYTELVNQSADLTLLATQIMPPFKPAPGDQGHVNRYTATRINGASVTYQDDFSSQGLGPGGVSKYESSGTFNINGDVPYVADRAQHEVHLGTVDAPRYPTFTMYLHKAVCAPIRQQWLSLFMLSRIDITQLRATFGISWDTASLILQGYSTQWNSKIWQVVANCTPAEPYGVVTLVDGSFVDTSPYAFRLQGTNNNQPTTFTASGILTGAASLTAVTQPGLPTWVTTMANPTDLPLPITVWGQKVTVTAITDNVADTFNRVTASGVGTADTGQVWTLGAGTASEFATNGSEFTVTNTAVNATHNAMLASLGLIDMDIRITINSNAPTPTGGPLNHFIDARYIDANNHYRLYAIANTSSTWTLTLMKIVAGVGTTLVAAVTILGVSTTSAVYCRFQVVGSTLHGKLWAVGTPEPALWAVTATDSTFAGQTGGFRISNFLDPLNTNTLPVVFRYDNLSIATQIQTFTLDPSTVLYPIPGNVPILVYMPAALGPIQVFR